MQGGKFNRGKRTMEPLIGISGIRDEASGVKGGSLQQAQRHRHILPALGRQEDSKQVNLGYSVRVPEQPEIPGKTLSQRQKEANKQKQVRPGRGKRCSC